MTQWRVTWFCIKKKKCRKSRTLTRLKGEARHTHKSYQLIRLVTDLFLMEMLAEFLLTVSKQRRCIHRLGYFDLKSPASVSISSQQKAWMVAVGCPVSPANGLNKSGRGKWNHFNGPSLILLMDLETLGLFSSNRRSSDAKRTESSRATTDLTDNSELSRDDSHLASLLIQIRTKDSSVCLLVSVTDTCHLAAGAHLMGNPGRGVRSQNKGKSSS